MPKVSAKRQITLPIVDCEALGIEPGDEVEILRYGNQINIIKKKIGAASGILKSSSFKKNVTVDQSIQSNFE